MIAWFSEQDQKSCSCKSGSLLSLINPAQANQAPFPSLTNPASANQANLSAWSILLRQIRWSGKRRKFMRSLPPPHPPNHFFQNNLLPGRWGYGLFFVSYQPHAILCTYYIFCSQIASAYKKNVVSSLSHLFEIASWHQNLWQHIVRVQNWQKVWTLKPGVVRKEKLC